MKCKRRNKMNFEEGALFDPGFIPHIQAFIPSIENIYYNLQRFKNFHQKKAHFKMFYPKIQQLLNNYIGFYLGCMLWAVYIKKYENKNLLNNLCIGGEYSEEETLSEVEFVEHYIKQLQKDAKYYLGENYTPEDSILKIVAGYKEFLKENEGFTKASTTDDVKIPSNFKKPSEEELNTILEKIEEVVETGNLFDLYPLTSTIL